MYELPPILQGSEREQLAALRAYLVRMAQSLDMEVEKAAESAAAQTASRLAASGGASGSASGAPAEISRLRSLIVKTAEQIRHTVETISTELHEDYLAVSDFGTYQEQISTRITETARAIVESYQFDAALEAVSTALSSIRGEIRRGLITDPETGETAMGIAISESLRFTGQEQTQNGLTYYELSPGQTLGLYTATGWQFWISGSKRGWFNSVDGMLHVSRLAVESSLTLGAGWLLTMSGGLGVRYVGV